MSSAKEQDAAKETSEICKFYKDKTVFITGAAGFLGMVILETLLRVCTDIRRIYILLRPKKGVQPEDRKEALFQKDLFRKLRENEPSTLKKVVVVVGDMIAENLGMSDTDLEKITREVSVVFHCAASVSFLKSLRFMMEQNVIGTYNVSEVCKKMLNFEVLVYTSTFYSNSNHKTIEEKIYELPFTVEEAMKLTRHGTDEELLSLYHTCKPNFINYYTFSKSVSEAVLSRFTHGPWCIIRPSIILCTYKGSCPGYVEDGSGVVTFGLAVGKGFIRVTRLDTTKNCEMIPADIVANTHIIAAFNLAKQRLLSPIIYNCTTDEKNTCKWGDFIEVMWQVAIKYPLPNTFQKPSLTIVLNPIKYRFLSFFEHYLPAYVIDVLLWMTGHKLRLLKLYKIYDKCMDSTLELTLSEWDKRIENFMSISEKLNSTDKELFPVAIDYTLEILSKCLIAGAPQFKYVDKKPEEGRMRLTYLRYFFTSMIKWSFLGGLASVFYLVVF